MPPALYTNPKHERGSFPIVRKDLRQTSLTLRVGVERDLHGQGRDAVDPGVLGRSLIWNHQPDAQTRPPRIEGIDPGRH